MATPAATYRIQFTPSFGFEDAEGIVDYLRDLGITDIYASPIFQAAEGSTHGYDVTDPNRLNPQLGSRQQFDRLLRRVRDNKMGWLQDIVPNHMAYHHHNQMLADFIEKGQDSRFADFFDVDLDYPGDSLRGKILAPFLGTSLIKAIGDGNIQLMYEDRTIWVCYYQHRFPLSLASYEEFLTSYIDELGESLRNDSELYSALNRTLESFANNPSAWEKIETAKKHLYKLYENNRAVADLINQTLERYNSASQHPARSSLLARLLAKQNFRLALWKTARRVINYRRFFYLNDFIALKPQHQDVFDYTHKLVFQMLEEGKFTGLRIDHIDGLEDPAAYLARLRQRQPSCCLLIEKILDLDEHLPGEWPVQGTTGYEFLNYLNGIFVDQAGEHRFDKIYGDFTGSRGSYQDMLVRCKRLVIRNNMLGEVSNLLSIVLHLRYLFPDLADLDRSHIKTAIIEVAANFGVYRTYTNSVLISQKDARYIKEAVRLAARNGRQVASAVSFLGEVLLFQLPDTATAKDKEKALCFIKKFQQLTAPTVAKGFEDTFIYRFNRLTSLNEVGSSPDWFGISLEKFHRFNDYRVSASPASLSATSTHDTKRGEDTRARINVLSEIPDRWKSYLQKWSRTNRHLKTPDVHGNLSPDNNDEYLLYQTLIGCWPFDEEIGTGFTDRIKQYIIKAVREAKIHTSWIRPDQDYENACNGFIEGILDPSDSNQFLADFLPFQQMVASFGIYNSLSQLAVKTTAPGVPDFYRGTELWDFSLVDPDNRRAVDYTRRMRLLSDIKNCRQEDLGAFCNHLLENPADPAVKLFLTHRLLQARKQSQLLFNRGRYLPLPVRGTYSHNIIAFGRHYQNSFAVTVAPRFLTSVIEPGSLPLGDRWQDTYVRLPENFPARFGDAVSGEDIEPQKKLPIADILSHFPVSLLISTL